MKEAQVVRFIESELDYYARWYVNNHGSAFGARGVADFITTDLHGVVVGVEAKTPGAAPYVNQFRQAVRMLLSGGRYIVAYGDVSVAGVLLGKVTVPRFVIGDQIGEAEFTAAKVFESTDVTTELVLP